jgi:UDP-N-acetylmuramoylalanine--D-glutamate ligase
MAGLAVERCKSVIAFGEHGPMIAQAVNHARRGSLHGQLREVKVVETLEEAVKIAEQMASAGDVVLLSPGGTSYDAYRDFAERGEHFRELVRDIKNQRRQF